MQSRHKIREVRRHGEAASANMSTIPAEQAWLQALLQAFAPRDIFNTNETGLFMYQQPS
jgi:hypothetical protein